MVIKLKYLFMSLSVPASVWVAFHLEGLGTFFSAYYAFILIPLLELLFKPNRQNLTEKQSLQLDRDHFFDFILYLGLPIQYFLLVYFLQLAPHLQGIELAGAIASFGTCCGALAINSAHELGHRRTWYEKLMAKALLLTSLYMHFYIEHNRGHHRNVGTFNDPGTARKGETIYAFWLRALTGCLRSAWNIDRGQMVKFLAIESLFMVTIYFAFGTKPLLAFLASAGFGILLLETVNYIEHYGLRREITNSGRPERIKVTHSWNSDHPVGRSALFELSRHSDHHAFSHKKYQTLNSHPESPQMPTGYPGMMVLTLLPPLWFRIMNPLLNKKAQQSQ